MPSSLAMHTSPRCGAKTRGAAGGRPVGRALWETAGAAVLASACQALLVCVRPIRN
jgi:hypothetical protein